MRKGGEGVRVATSKQTSIHTYLRNAVPLVWGSLRLAPKNWLSAGINEL